MKTSVNLLVNSTIALLFNTRQKGDFLALASN